MTTQTFPVYINVVGKPIALKDTTICAGSNTQLVATRGGSYTWAVLPGGSAGSLSCTTCANPIATPAITTSYQVTSAASAACGNNKDTVTITVVPVNVPTITMPPTILIFGPSPVTITATTANCNAPTYIWKRNGVVIAGATGSSYTYTPSGGMGTETYTCEMTCGDPCSNPQKVTDTTSCKKLESVEQTTPGLEVAIYPNPSNGSFEIAGYAAANSNIQYTITNTAGQTILNDSYVVKAGSYKQTLKTNLPAGVYILKLQDDNSSAIQKLIIQ